MIAGAARSTMDELAEATLAADRVLVVRGPAQPPETNPCRRIHAAMASPMACGWSSCT